VLELGRRCDEEFPSVYPPELNLILYENKH
jgi:hypothetical protein